MNIVREDPPAVGPGRKANKHWSEVADQLADDLGNWYRIAEGQKHYQLITRINKGQNTAFRPAGAFEAVGRKTDDGTYSIWARYIGVEG